MNVPNPCPSGIQRGSYPYKAYDLLTDPRIIKGHQFLILFLKNCTFPIRSVIPTRPKIENRDFWKILFLSLDLLWYYCHIAPHVSGRLLYTYLLDSASTGICIPGTMLGTPIQWWAKHSSNWRSRPIRKAVGIWSVRKAGDAMGAHRRAPNLV